MLRRYAKWLHARRPAGPSWNCVISTGRAVLCAVLLSIPGAARAADRPINYEGYDRLTRAYVNDSGRVDYRGLKRELPALKRFVDELAAVSPESNPELFRETAEQLRYYATAYNAWVLYIAATEYPSKTPLWRFGLFRNRDIRLGGRGLTLNDLEHGILRKRFEDPRIHFYINCAAASCPPFPRGAIPAGQTAAALDRAARSFINNPSYVRFDADRGELRLSKILDWFQEDFLKFLKSRKGIAKPHISQYVLLYLEGPAKEALARVPPGNLSVRYFSYDKSLNEQ